MTCNYYKSLLVAAILVNCALKVYTQQQDSAASASQIKYAESMNYDNTGPGATEKPKVAPFDQSFQMFSSQMQDMKESPRPVAYSTQNQVNFPRPIEYKPQTILYSKYAIKKPLRPQQSLQYQPQDVNPIQMNTLQQDYEDAPQQPFGVQDEMVIRPQQLVSNVVYHQPQNNMGPSEEAGLSRVYKPIKLPRPYYPTQREPVPQYTSNQLYAYNY